MIRLAAEAGVVGGSIEDATGDPQDPIYDFQLAVERVHAAIEVARSLPIPFTLTARAENLLHGRRTSTTRSGGCRRSSRPARTCCTRPGSGISTTIRTVVSSLTRPVNVVATTLDPSITVAQLAEAGVKRISVGGSLSRLALAAFLRGRARDEGRGRVHVDPRHRSEPGAPGDLHRRRRDADHVRAGLSRRN